MIQEKSLTKNHAHYNHSYFPLLLHMQVASYSWQNCSQLGLLKFDVHLVCSALPLAEGLDEGVLLTSLGSN